MKGWGHAVTENGRRYWFALIVGTERRMRRASIAARLRALAAVVFLGWYGELCEQCGRNYFDTIWWCEDNNLWRQVSGHDTGGLLCPKCFDLKAERAGLSLVWHPTVSSASDVAGES